MKISKHLSGVPVKRSLPKLSLTAKLAFASAMFLNFEASAGTSANKTILNAAVFKSAHLSNINFDDITITGRILDEKGQPLIGVSVKVKGRNTGVSTDATGSFTIVAPENGTLVLSYIGYATQEVPVSGNKTIVINLTPSANSLNEVVVTALGIRKDERKLGYSVSTVNGEDLNKARESNVALSLEGRVAGLSVGGTNGGPGSSARVLLRGVTSFGASSPLYVINGVPMDNTQRGSSSEWGGADYGDGIANINPDDIETMTVLKGQSASALYGSRAANGVILITTKTGKKNSGVGVEYNTNFQFDKAIDYTKYQTIYGQGQLGATGVVGVKPLSVSDALNTGNLAWGAKLDGSQVIQLDGQMHTYSAVKNNWSSFYRVAPSYTNTVAVTGGGETGAFRLSASDLRANSIVPNSYDDRKTLTLSATQSVSKKLEVTLNANYIVENGHNRSSLSDGPGNPNNVQFLAPNEDQSILKPGYNTVTGKETSFTNDIYVTNPYFAAYNFSSNTVRNRLISSTAAKYNFTDWLYAQARLGYDKINDQRIDITPTGTAYASGNGSMSQTNGDITEMNTELLIGAKHDIVKDLLNVDVTVGGNIRNNIVEGTNINGNNFIIPYFYSLTNVPSRNSSVNYQALQTNSAYYTADFGIKNFLVLSTTGRYDTYSNLPSANRGIFTPSVAGSFIFSDLYPVKGLDLGKIRASYAQTSGQPTAVYATTQYYNVNNSVNGVSTAGFSYALPNLFLKPFTLTELELGTEMKFWGDRLGFDISYFARKTHNEISTGTLDISSGYTSRYIGTGSTQNRGIEVEIHGTPVRSSSGFSWTPAFNFTYVVNKILQTDGTNTNVSFGTYRPLNASTAVVAGMSGPQILAYDYKRNAAGQIVYDASGLPERGAYKPMGSVVPKVYGGLNNSFNYKQFNLSFLADYRFAVKILSATNYYSIYRGLNQLTLAGRETGVVGVGVNDAGATNTVNVPAQTYYQALARNISALNVLDGSFIKLRQVTFGYTISKQTLIATPFSSITVSLVGRNLATLLKHSGNIDPESGFSSTIQYAGIEGTSLPATRTYGFNVNFKFKK